MPTHSRSPEGVGLFAGKRRARAAIASGARKEFNTQCEQKICLVLVNAKGKLITRGALNILWQSLMI